MCFLCVFDNASRFYQIMLSDFRSRNRKFYQGTLISIRDQYNKFDFNTDKI